MLPLCSTLFCIAKDQSKDAVVVVVVEKEAAHRWCCAEKKTEDQTLETRKKADDASRQIGRSTDPPTTRNKKMINCFSISKRKKMFQLDESPGGHGSLSVPVHLTTISQNPTPTT